MAAAVGRHRWRGGEMLVEDCRTKTYAIDATLPENAPRAGDSRDPRGAGSQRCLAPGHRQVPQIRIPVREWSSHKKSAQVGQTRASEYTAALRNSPSDLCVPIAAVKPQTAAALRRVNNWLAV